MELMGDEIQKYVKIAHDRLVSAYAPYSNFPVSAVLLLKDGSIFTGVNIENVSFGATVCAERVAMFSAINSGYSKEDFQALIVAANTHDYISPCSLCRQVFVEFFPPELPVYLANKELEYTKYTVNELVPLAFTSLKM